MGVGILTRSEMTQTAVSPKPTPPWVKLTKGNIGVHFTVCRKLNRLEIVLSKILSWSKPLPGILVCLYFFQSAWLVSATFGLLTLGESCIFNFFFFAV